MLRDARSLFKPLGCCAVAALRAIKVLSDLSIVFQLISIDIQVLSDLVPRFGWCAVAARRGAIILFILRILAILLQTQKRAADKPPRDKQMHREKAPRSFMSIKPQQHGEKVRRSLIMSLRALFLATPSL